MTGQEDEKAPDSYTKQEGWAVDNVVSGIYINYRQTGVDTAETEVTLVAADGKQVTWKDSTFRKIFDLQLGYNSIASVKHEVQRRVETRRAYDRRNVVDLREYRRLAKKFGSLSPTSEGE